MSEIKVSAGSFSFWTRESFLVTSWHLTVCQPYLAFLDLQLRYLSLCFHLCISVSLPLLLLEGHQPYWALRAHANQVWQTWAFLVAQMVKNLPVMQETQAQSLGWEDPLENGMATYSIILIWRIPWIEEPGRLHYSPRGRKESDTTEWLPLSSKPDYICNDYFQKKSHSQVLEVRNWTYNFGTQFKPQNLL